MRPLSQLQRALFQLSVGLFALGLGLFGFGCDDTIRDTQFPILEVSPTTLVLTPVPLGQTTQGVITLRNRGGSRLRITDIDFTNETDEREFTKTHVELPLILEANESTPLHIFFSPRVHVLGSAEIVIRSNDKDEPVKRVRITTTTAEQNLSYEPEALYLEAQRIGDSVSGQVKITNRGLIPVNILDAYLSTETAAQLQTEDDIAQRPTLSISESVEYTITYTPTHAETVHGELIVLTDDDRLPRIAIPLMGTLPRPVITVTPGSVNFGPIELGERSEPVILVVENRGSAPLELQEISLSFAPEGVNEQFSLIFDEGEASPLTLAPDSAELFTFTAQYHPTIEGRHRTAIVFKSNDPVQSLLTVPIEGRVPRPCISVTPGQVSFGVVGQGQRSARQPVQIANCGDLPLDLREIRIASAEGEPHALFEWAPMDDSPPVDQPLAPLSAATIQVWYQNSGLDEGALDEAHLLITSNAPDQPEVDVPLSVIGGGAPTCDMLVLPNRADFGLITRRSAASRQLEVVNRGTGACQVRSEAIAPLLPIPGLPVPFFLTRPVGVREIDPGEFVPFEITYRPLTFGSDGANYTINYFDPFSNRDKSATATLSGIAGESNIAVIPSRLDFGQVTAGSCASREERVSIYNTGLVDLCVRDVQFEGACDDFFLVDRPVADADGCIRVNRGSPADFHFVYEPGELGADLCEVVFLSDASDYPELRVPLMGEGVADSRQTDIFEQSSGQTVDVLFVVDSSGSMQEEQANLARNFASFISGAQTFNNDYQLAVVTTDMDSSRQSGRIQGAGIIGRGPDVERIFTETVNVGTSGSADEKGLEAAQKALSDPLIFDSGVACTDDSQCTDPDQCIRGFCGGHNRGFLRDEAALEIVFVSDEDDFSPGTLNFYVDFFKNIKGFRNEGRFRASAIVGANNGRAASCSSDNGSADAGRRYVEVADRTNGQVFSICDADFGHSLREIGNRAFGLPVQFFLTRPAVPESVEVTVNGSPRNRGWSYEASSNSVVFTPDSVPQPGDTIVVNYEAQCFPRRH